MTLLAVTTALKAAQPGDEHGSIYLINLETQQILKPVSWSDQGGVGKTDQELGLRGLAFHGERVYVASSDKILVFDPTFELLNTIENPYLKDCQQLTVFGQHLFALSAGFDSILGFNLEDERFDWAFKVVTDGRVFGVKSYDPNGNTGPLQINKLKLNSLSCDQKGMYLSGKNTEALLKFSGKAIGVLTTLPKDVNCARLHLEGVLFCDAQADAFRFESPTVRIALPLPRLRSDTLPEQTKANPQGICLVSDDQVAVGSQPATLTVYDLAKQKPGQVINLSTDSQNTVFDIQKWPFSWPSKD
ncbi:MAG: hypothetical protein AAF438_00675 [Pseudomonadota bacterium]